MVTLQDQGYSPDEPSARDYAVCEACGFTTLDWEAMAFDVSRDVNGEIDDVRMTCKDEAACERRQHEAWLESLTDPDDRPFD